MEQTANVILTEKQGHIFIITINRPETKNAFNSEASLQMSQAIDEFENDQNLFIAIITGAGGTFSAGADLIEAAKGIRKTTPRGGFGIFKKPPSKPIIAAVEGYAVAGGMELCLACDLIVAAKDAKMGLPEVKHNLVAIGGGLFRLPKRMPYHLVMEMALTGEMYPVDYFHRYGIVNHVVERGEALQRAIELANKIIQNGPTALEATKQIIRHSFEWNEEEAWTNQMKYAEKALKSEDRKEGLRAFAEKRKPVWKGF